MKYILMAIFLIVGPCAFSNEVSSIDEINEKIDKFELRLSHWQQHTMSVVDSLNQSDVYVKKNLFQLEDKYSKFVNHLALELAYNYQVGNVLAYVNESRRMSKQLDENFKVSIGATKYEKLLSEKKLFFLKSNGISALAINTVIN